MREFINGFFRQLADAMAKTSCTGPSGGSLALDEALDKAYGLIRETSRSGGKVIVIGNGGSAGIASHISVDFWKNGGVKSMAFNDPSLLTCLANDLGVENIFSAPVAAFAEKRDTLLAISSSGKSPNILNAVKAAKEKGCSLITMSGFKPDNPLSKTGDVNFYVPSSGYGYVETAHAALCHCLVDCAIAGKKV
jgi:D-sedoheptulose 7-phosphate isomerase